MSNTQLATIPSALKDMMPALPQDMNALFASMLGAGMTSFGGNFNRLSLKGNRFHLMEGKNEVATRADFLDICIVAIGSENYKVWYEKGYDPNQEDVKPDAMWGDSDPVPANVPAHALEKDEKGRNRYSTRRRIVFMLSNLDTVARTVDVDTDKLYVFDINAMSMFGDDVPSMQAFSLGGLMNHLKNNGVWTCATGSRLLFDSSQSVPVVKFRPYADGTGNIVQYPMPILQKIAGAMKERQQEIQDLLDWRRGGEEPAAAPNGASQAELDASRQEAAKLAEAARLRKAEEDRLAAEEAQRQAAARARAEEAARQEQLKQAEIARQKQAEQALAGEAVAGAAPDLASQISGALGESSQLLEQQGKAGMPGHMETTQTFEQPAGTGAVDFGGMGTQAAAQPAAAAAAPAAGASNLSDALGALSGAFDD